MDLTNKDRIKIARLEKRVSRLEQEIKDLKRKAADDLWAERKRSSYKLARIINRRKEKTDEAPSDCLICMQRQGKIYHCNDPCACRNVICDQCLSDPRYDRRCLLCKRAPLKNMAPQGAGQSSSSGMPFIFGSYAGGIFGL